VFFSLFSKRELYLGINSCISCGLDPKKKKILGIGVLVNLVMKHVGFSDGSYTQAYFSFLRYDFLRDQT
jgi:hypothetical protein